MKSSLSSKKNPESKQFGLQDSCFSKSISSSPINQDAQYFLLNQRITNVQVLLTKLSKKTSKIQKQISGAYSDQGNKFDGSAIEKQVKNQIKKLQRLKDQRIDSSQLDFSQLIDVKDMLVREIKSQLKQTVKKAIINIQKHGQSMLHKLQSERGLNISNITDKIKEIQMKNKVYVDKSIQYLKSSVMQFSKQKTNFPNIYKIDKHQPKQELCNYLLDQSETALNIRNLRCSSSSQKSRSQALQQPFSNIQNTKSSEKLRTSRKQNSSASKVINSRQNNNRVSYLRQKLLQFQKINQKYQKTTEKPQQNKNNTKKLDSNSSAKAFQKMKDLKNFLLQSQSQIEPSQIMYQKDESFTLQKKTDKKMKVEKFINTQFRR